VEIRKTIVEPLRKTEMIFLDLSSILVYCIRAIGWGGFTNLDPLQVNQQPTNGIAHWLPCCDANVQCRLYRGLVTSSMLLVRTKYSMPDLCQLHVPDGNKDWWGKRYQKPCAAHGIHTNMMQLLVLSRFVGRDTVSQSILHPSWSCTRVLFYFVWPPKACQVPWIVT